MRSVFLSRRAFFRRLDESIEVRHRRDRLGTFERCFYFARPANTSEC